MALKFLLRHKKALSLLISVAMLATIVSIVGVKEIANAIATIEKRYLALALGIFILSLLVSALRWQLLINALGTRTRYG
ncbi:MAG: flippase-like domain-containing protein, partial [Candidatus Methanofastidiosa archaeon]|nr:flippase-like domain-containing protein [Candidatus Methanofastidiosa archaeon]